MTRVLSIAAVLVAASMAVAAEPAGFGFAGVVDTGFGLGIPVPNDGTPVEVTLIAVGDGVVGGMQAYVETSAPFLITDPAVENIGGMWNNPGSSLAAVADAQLGYFATLWAFGSGNNAVADGDILAKFNVSVPPGTPVGTTGFLTTDTPSYGPSMWDTALPTGQATVSLIVVPEPVSALLLLAGLPLVRRRRA